MRSAVRQLFTATLLVAAFASPAVAQQRAGLMGDLMKDIDDVQEKLTGLAKAIPAEKFDWRPGAGVRSVGEVFLHVTADNYVMPFAVGVDPDPATGINMKDFKTFAAFEKQKMDRDAMMAAMDKSFAHLRKAMTDTPDAKLDERVKFFGQDMSVRQVWVMTTTHLHEHLGQAIAYARTNGVVPPCSK
jgi:uncharacterized damage-inducible protein DinB